MRLIVKNLPLKTTEEDIRMIFGEYGTITDVFLPKKNKVVGKGVCFVGYAEECHALEAIRQRHKSYVKNKRITVEIVKENTFKKLKDELNRLISGDEDVKKTVVEVKSKTLYLTKLPLVTKEKHIAEYFSDCDIDSIKLVYDNTTKKFYGHAIVKMKDFVSAKKAFEKDDIFLGCRINISFYQESLERKQHYFRLFFNFESVIESVCNEANVTKKEFVDIKDKNLATRIALVETHLVDQTKQFLKDNNIDLDHLTGEVDKRVLIVRNSNLLSLDFKDCIVKMAPSKCLAILEFCDENAAKKVYDELQYKRIKNKTIYVDYMPLSHKLNTEIKFTNKLIVKNVPFQAEKHEIWRLISSKFKIRDIRLPKQHNGMHKGYCFIISETAEDSKAIYNYFGNNTHLYGRRLVIEPAQK